MTALPPRAVDLSWRHGWWCGAGLLRCCARCWLPAACQSTGRPSNGRGLEARPASANATEAHPRTHRFVDTGFIDTQVAVQAPGNGTSAVPGNARRSRFPRRRPELIPGPRLRPFDFKLSTTPGSLPIWCGDATPPPVRPKRRPRDRGMSRARALDCMGGALLPGAKKLGQPCRSHSTAAPSPWCARSMFSSSCAHRRARSSRWTWEAVWRPSRASARHTVVTSPRSARPWPRPQAFTQGGQEQLPAEAGRWRAPSNIRLLEAAVHSGRGASKASGEGASAPPLRVQFRHLVNLPPIGTGPAGDASGREPPGHCLGGDLEALADGGQAQAGLHAEGAQLCVRRSAASPGPGWATWYGHTLQAPVDEAGAVTDSGGAAVPPSST